MLDKKRDTLADWLHQGTKALINMRSWAMQKLIKKSF
jgi:hypothetical protein